MNNKKFTSKKKQKGAIGAVMLLAVTFVLIIYSIITKNKLINDINDQQDVTLEELVDVIASQMSTLKSGTKVWFDNTGIDLLYPLATCGGALCLDVKYNILPSQAASLRLYGGFTNGFARNQRDQNEINFYSPLGRPYVVDVVKQINVAKPGEFSYKFIISHN
ncbi:MAG: hypothetical protein QM504_03345 [Pseudomonadota bacterium]